MLHLLEIGFQWGTTRISIRTFIILNIYIYIYIYINDLDDSITSNILKFADDTKVFRKVILMVINNIYKKDKWQMLLNFAKCKCLHTGHGNLDINNNMEYTVLCITVKEKDSGITISADIKVSELCGIAASKRNQILGLIRKNTTYKEKS